MTKQTIQIRTYIAHGCYIDTPWEGTLGHAQLKALEDSRLSPRVEVWVDGEVAWSYEWGASVEALRATWQAGSPVTLGPDHHA